MVLVDLLHWMQIRARDLAPNTDMYGAITKIANIIPIPNVVS